MKDTLTKQEVIDLCERKQKDLVEKASSLRSKADSFELEAKVWSKTREEVLALMEKA